MYMPPITSMFHNTDSDKFYVHRVDHEINLFKVPLAKLLPKNDLIFQFMYTTFHENTELPYIS